MWAVLLAPLIAWGSVAAWRVKPQHFPPMKSVFTPAMYERDAPPAPVLRYGYYDDCGLPGECGKNTP